MNNEYTIDFNKLEIADSEYDRDGDKDKYSAVLEYGGRGNQEETDRFQYEIMKRAGIDKDLRDVGIEVDNFEKFQQLGNDNDVQLKIELSYVEYGLSHGLVADALYGERSTAFTYVPLNDVEQEQLEQFYDDVLSEDKKQQKSEYDMEME